MWIGGREGREKRGTNLNECVTFAVIDFKDGCHISTAITIVGCTKYSDDFLFLP